MYLCLFFCFLAIILSFLFKTVPNTRKESETLHKYLKDLRYSFRYLLKSNRLKSLILFCGIFFGFINLLNSLRRSLLQDVGMSVQMIGIVFADYGIFAAVSAAKANWFNKKLKNHFLSFVAIFLTLSAITSGLTITLNLPLNIITIVVSIMFAIQFIIKGSYFTLNKKYLSSFSTSSLRTKIYSLNNMFESICAAVTSFICSIMLNYMETSLATVILGCAFALILIIVLYYMKPRVGIKPDQYKKEDIPVEVR